jgi:hypothetical protein
MGDTDFRIARLFDGISADGVPYFDAQHPRIDDEDEREKVGRFLGSAPFVLRTTGRDVDYLDPDRPRVVGMSFRTDGRWIWSDALGYYVTAHGLAPEQEFVDHIRSHEFTPSKPDEATLLRAVDVIRHAQASPSAP